MVTKVDEFQRLRLAAGDVFSPSAPIDERDLFAGRRDHLSKVIDIINQRGQHAIIFGERGVGKTSLANVLAPWLESLGKTVVAPRINCDGSDTFVSVWRKALTEFQASREIRMAGFQGAVTVETQSLSEAISRTTNPDQIRRILTSLASDSILIIIFDEFDRLAKTNVTKLFADTIKALSDHSVRATLVLVGVADSVDQLISEHRSVERALIQIHMERMSHGELRSIVQNGVSRLAMNIDEDALMQIVNLSQGLPHYTHLLGLHACRVALRRQSKEIEPQDMEGAIKEAVAGAQQTVQQAYQLATMSPRKDNLYADVLLACALAPTDEFGFFAAADLRDPLRRITGKNYDIPNYAQHLANFCEEDRGPVLDRRGKKRRFRFRFSNALVQPFIVLKGYSDGKSARLLDAQPAIIHSAEMKK